MMQNNKILRIGRNPDCDIVLNADTTSREHAVLRIDARGRMFLTDNSTNGTFVNGNMLVKGVEYQVTRDDYVDFAHAEVLRWSYVPQGRESFSNLTPLWILLTVALLAIGLLAVFKLGDLRITKGPVDPVVQIDTVTKTVHDTLIVDKKEPPVVTNAPKKTKGTPSDAKASGKDKSKNTDSSTNKNENSDNSTNNVQLPI